MYIPHYNAMADADVHDFVTSIGSAEIVTVRTDGTPISTLLPILWSDDGTTIVAHLARANDHWRQMKPGCRALAIVAGPQAYISPAWYASKVEHGRVVPTWNYSAVHLTGALQVHDDPIWVREAVTRLTERHEQSRHDPWSVTDAPDDYVDKSLRAIVGLEMTIERIEAKAKLSQNRSDADRAGVIAGLRSEDGNLAVADAMEG